MKKRSLARVAPALAPETCYRRSRLGTIFAATMFAGMMSLAALTACTSEPVKPAESAPKGPELLGGRSAFQKGFVAARGWAPDGKCYRIESMVTTDGGNGRTGKWAVWRSSFASAAQRSTKSYTWSGSGADGAPARGVNPNPEDSYNPTNSSTQTFDVNFLKIDSGQAFATALEAWRRQNSGKGPRHPHLLYLRLESQHQRTDLARDLWRHPRHRQVDGRGQRLHRRVHPGGKITAGK